MKLYHRIFTSPSTKVLFFITLTVAIFAQSAVSAPVQAATHPYLLFNQAQLSQYQQDRSQPGLRGDLFSALETYVAAQNWSTLNDSRNATVAAFYALLTDNQSYRTIAKQKFMALINQSCWNTTNCGDRIAAEILAHVAILYDWLYPYLTTTERQQAATKLASETCLQYQQFVYGANKTGWSNWWYQSYTQNHFQNHLGGLLLGALAITNDNPPSCIAEVIDAAKGRVDPGKIINGSITATNQDMINYALTQRAAREKMIYDQVNDGSYSEGIGYMDAYFNAYPQAMWAADTILGQDLLSQSRLQAFPLFYLYNSVPDLAWKQLMFYGDHLNNSVSTYAFTSQLALTANISQNPLGNWLLNSYYSQVSPKIKTTSPTTAYNAILSFIYYQSTLGSQSPAQLKFDLSYYASDLQGMFTRSDWGTPAVAVGLKAGPPGGTAAHQIALSNLQFNGSSWDKVGGGQPPQEFSLNTGHMHNDANGLYIYANGQYLLPELNGYDEPWGPRCARSHNTILVNNLGQADDGTATACGAPSTSNNQYDTYADIKINHYASTAHYSYSMGQAAGAYGAGTGLTQFDRHLLFIRQPGYLLTVDDLDATTTKTYSWMGHSLESALNESPWIKVNSDNNQVLGIRVLTPTTYTFSTRTVTDPTKFIYIDNDDTLFEWSLKQTCQSCRFVLLHWPTTTANWSQKPNITTLASTPNHVVLAVTVSPTRTDYLGVNLNYGSLIQTGPINTNARSFGIQTDNGIVSNFYLSDGSNLTYNNQVLLQSPTVLKVWETVLINNTVTTRTSNFTQVQLFAPSATQVTGEMVNPATNRITVNALNFTKSGNLITITNPTATPAPPTPTPVINLKLLLTNWLTNQFDQDNNQKLNSLDWLLSTF